MDSVCSFTRYEYRQAVRYLRQGHFRSCLRVAERQISTTSLEKVEFAFQVLSIRSLVKLGEYTRAMFQAQALVTRFPGSHPALFLLAFSMEKQGRQLLEPALECFQKALELRPDHIPTIRSIVRILLRQQKIEEAMNHQRKLVVARPQHSQALRRLIGMAKQTGQRKEAGNLIRQGRFLFPNCPWFATRYQRLAHERPVRPAAPHSPRLLPFAVDFPSKNPNHSPSHERNLVLRLEDSPRFAMHGRKPLRDRKTPG